MPLSCSCATDDEGPFSWPDGDFSVYPDGKRGKRCASCQSTVIHSGDDCLKFRITRPARDDIEYNIYGDDAEAIPMANRYFCEVCAGLYFAFEDLGYCVHAWENMRELAGYYRELKS